ncbi:MAG TPA: hypothetical protein PKK26_09600 [Candidatus Wallbacteria bacterium]|nr:hypothetical protein [Candidatus Wallbacteria bacterium]
MPKSQHLKIIYFMRLLAAFFCLCLLLSAGRSLAGKNSDPIRNIELKSRLTCAKIKKKLTSARELYMVENPASRTLEVRLVDIVKSGYLRFEPVCPEGGKYSLDTFGVILCSKCDAQTAPLPEKTNERSVPETAGTTEAEVKKSAATLESSINRYLNKDDAVVASIGEEQARKEKIETAEVSAPREQALPQDNFLAGTEESKAGNPSDGTEQIPPPQEGMSLAKGAMDFHNEAIGHARRGEVEQALEKFQKAIELVPSSFTYHYNYALYLAKIESYDQSYVEFQRAMRLNPTNKKVKDMIEKLKKAISTK